MASVSIAELQGDLNRYLRLAQEGEEVIVSDHGSPVARISSVPTQQHTPARMDMSVARRITPAKHPLTRERLAEIYAIGAHLPPDPDLPRKLLEALLEERDEDYR